MEKEFDILNEDKEFDAALELARELLKDPNKKRINIDFIISFFLFF